MVADGLVCAHCAHPVAEGRCVVCRAARDEIEQRTRSTQLLVAITGAIALLIVVLLHLHG